MACVVKKCKSRMGKEENLNEYISFHRFPNDKVIQRLWIDAVTQEVGWTPKNHHRVCSRHFTSACFNSDDQFRRRLKEHAVPKFHLQSTDIKNSMATATPCLDSTKFSDITPTKFTRTMISSDPISSVTTITSDLPLLGRIDETNCNQCPMLEGRIDKLKKEVFRLEKLAQRRLLKINSLRQHSRRLKKKNVVINSRLIDILRNEKNSIAHDP